MSAGLLTRSIESILINAVDSLFQVGEEDLSDEVAAVLAGLQRNPDLLMRLTIDTSKPNQEANDGTL